MPEGVAAGAAPGAPPPLDLRWLVRLDRDEPGGLATAAPADRRSDFEETSFFAQNGFGGAAEDARNTSRKDNRKRGVWF